MHYGGLILTIVMAWLVHGGLVLLYRKWFPTTKMLSFRLTHVLEIFLTTGAAMYVYVSQATNRPSVFLAIATTLGLLLMLDSVLLVRVKTLRQSFDLWHFIAAYLAVAGAVLIAFNL
jgi:hypothetical protein